MYSKGITYFREKPVVSGAIIKSFQEHKTFLYFCLYFFLLSYLFLNFSIGYSKTEMFSNFVLLFLNSLVFSTSVLAIYVTKLLVAERPKDSPLMFCYRAILRDVLPEENRWRILFCIVGLSLVISAFLVVKVSIPKVVPFSYDMAFEEIDRWLHLGYQPWELLQPLLGHEWVTLFLHKLYYFWFPVIYVTFFWQAGARVDNELRMQFILSFVACWVIIGGVMATMLSSVGPIYYDRIVPGTPDTYSAAMGYLLALDEKHEMYMFTVKEYLWSYYVNQIDNGPVKGISAMPSMHVSIAFLLALFGWRKGLYFGIAYSLFALAIFLGSIHLLWHYAIDGYVSILATMTIWLLAGRYVKATMKQKY